MSGPFCTGSPKPPPHRTLSPPAPLLTQVASVTSARLPAASWKISTPRAPLLPRDLIQPVSADHTLFLGGDFCDTCWGWSPGHPHVRRFPPTELPAISLILHGHESQAPGLCPRVRGLCSAHARAPLSRVGMGTQPTLADSLLSVRKERSLASSPKVLGLANCFRKRGWGLSFIF